MCRQLGSECTYPLPSPPPLPAPLKTLACLNGSILSQLHRQTRGAYLSVLRSGGKSENQSKIMRRGWRRVAASSTNTRQSHVSLRAATRLAAAWSPKHRAHCLCRSWPGSIKLERVSFLKICPRVSFLKICPSQTKDDNCCDESTHTAKSDMTRDRALQL